eukprot:1157414-Pelagomonas_calceolata.AAC.6
MDSGWCFCAFLEQPRGLAAISIYLLMEKAEIAACWKVAKITPLFKEGSVLDPGNDRMLAGGGHWMVPRKGQNSRHLVWFLPWPQHLAAHVYFAALTARCSGQAPKCITKTACSIHRLSSIQSSMIMHDLRKPSLLSPFLNINDVDCLAENVQGAITGTSDLRVTHMLYADDLCLSSNQPDQLQLMLDRLPVHVHAQRKGLVINVANLKSEVVHINSRGDDLPVFTLGGARVACADCCRHLGMLFTKQRNLQASAEYMCAPFLPGTVEQAKQPKTWLKVKSSCNLMDRLAVSHIDWRPSFPVTCKFPTSTKEPNWHLFASAKLPMEAGAAMQPFLFLSLPCITEKCMRDAKWPPGSRKGPLIGKLAKVSKQAFQVSLH